MPSGSLRPEIPLRKLLPLMLVPMLLIAACGGSDDKPEADSPGATQQGSDASDAPDTSEIGQGADEQVVCNLLTDEEVAAATGLPVVRTEGNIMQLPSCDWELDVSEYTGPGACQCWGLCCFPRMSSVTVWIPWKPECKILTG